ncbi:hypothetical protein [Shewanella sp.]|uniref:hypothetical protein n=1 Tax=Shewanella sp. TaxID=50422 RepID=UPI003A97783B
MDWQLIQSAKSAEQRIALFLFLQQRRYGNPPNKAALALWKGYRSHDIGKCLYRDILRLNGNVAQVEDADVREYLTRLLTSLAILQSHAASSHQPQS